MKAKTVLYAAVGAPVVAARKIGDRVEEIRASLNKEGDSLTKSATKRLDAWAREGQKLIDKITDAKVVDELTAKVDFDQVSNQVGKLRDQLEDMLSTWRSSFRPEKLPTVKVQASTSGVKIETAPARSARKSTSSNGAVKKTAAKSTAKASAKKSSAKNSAAKKAPARKAPARKAPATRATSVAS